MNMLDINRSNLHKLFRDFYTLTGIKVVFLDNTRKMLMNHAPQQSTFCSVVRNHEYWGKKCRECDSANVEQCARSGRSIKYRCHLGLTEAITPVYDKNGILGYITFGQMLLDEYADEAKERLKKMFKEEEFPGITEAIDNILIKTQEELEASVTILEAITSYMLSNQWVVPQKSGFIRHMDKYIENNLENNIGVDDICREFRIRRTHLYSVAKEYLGCSIAQYIREQRISHACRMLRETDDSISTIAYKTGFSDYGHFSRIFRQIQGVSASNYRKQHNPNF